MGVGEVWAWVWWQRAFSEGHAARPSDVESADELALDEEGTAGSERCGSSLITVPRL